MITIENATVETLDQTQARPMNKTVLSVTIGDHTFDMLVDEDSSVGIAVQVTHTHTNKGNKQHVIISLSSNHCYRSSTGIPILRI